MYTYQITASDLGAVGVVREPAGICAIVLGDDGEKTASEISRQWPDSALATNDGHLQKACCIIAARVDDYNDHGLLPLPLRPRGTPFQHRVWAALQHIAAGHTCTYGALARGLGQPSAARAVAAACAANPLAVWVPCHRVVGSNGKLTGYRWGLARKQALLLREQTWRAQRPTQAPCLPS